ncbi:RnfH family protein [Luteimonas sp. SJ-92]|uniref:UPF0125 protein H0E84_14435 n=1 Tax=Luteimonas salinisoli TaxID=2752307 RepID=A0A853JFF0_9GAMM|nr:RnfH family protein [Luteimonas salinisoli]NZA27575.1 RnfH family protein [Luteimonas salinisoli]
MAVRVEVVRAWPRRFESVAVTLDEPATVADAVTASGLGGADDAGYAVFGERATGATTLREGDRVELLRPLQADPKESRRRRAQARRG